MIKFDSVEWDHLRINEELFKKNNQEPVIKFASDIKNLNQDIISYLSFIDLVSKNHAKEQDDLLASNKYALIKCKEKTASLQKRLETVKEEASQIQELIQLGEERLKNVSKNKEELLQTRTAFYDEIKKTYTSLICAKDYYKDRLKMYFTVDTPTDSDDILVLIEFFTSKKGKETYYSVNIKKNTTSNQCTLVSTNPSLPIFKKLAKRLEESGDIRGLLCCIRKCFINIKR